MYEYKCKTQAIRFKMISVMAYLQTGATLAHERAYNSNNRIYECIHGFRNNIPNNVVSKCIEIAFQNKVI